ncbi:hypothetical protein AB0J83_08840 [Actinoplanes sp. NPDC049596]|uniref:hypothetical protein n=1 Tax=unclassified Actinoplanes TaxID=2626549 RepID=UPI00341F9C53
MTISQASHSVVSWPARLWRSSVYGLALLPLALAGIIAALAGRSGAAAGWWVRLRGFLVPQPLPARRPSVLAVLGHSALSVLLGATALIPLGVELLVVLRGLLYGVVDHGPYDHSWGGPSRAGAWLTHFAVGVPMAAAAAFALVGLAATHERLTAALAGQRRAPWVIPVALVVPLPAIVFFIAWLHQI